MGSLRGTRRTCCFGGVWSTLLTAMLLSSAGYLDSLAWAQTCGSTLTTSIRVDNATPMGTLRAAVNCTDGGIVEVNWAGVVTLDAPIAIADGTFLSVTGEDDLAEVHGDNPETNGTRLFELSPGGGLTLTHIKVSGGVAAEGGAIYSSSGTLTLDDCVFDGNVATEGNGGAVWANGGNVTIMGGEFLANNAARLGGAVYATDGRLEVNGGSRFERNEALAGGALFCGSTTDGSATSTILCSLAETEFMSNRAIYEHEDGEEGAFVFLEGGGAAGFLFTDATVVDSVFSENYARISGGALYGGDLTNVSVNGCTFDNNTSEQDGGAISASSMRLGGNTLLENNSARNKGGAVFGWDASGKIVINEILCTYNSAGQNGGCFHGAGKGVVNDGAVMLDNYAEHGGSIYANTGGDIDVNGGEFTCRRSERGGFLFAGDNSTVKVTGGLIVDNVSTRKGGAIYASGNGVSDVSIEGGTFINNTALEGGGAIAFWGPDVLVTITGGTFDNNNAAFFGGFVFMEIEGSFNCKGATVTGNFAGVQGGGIYAREATWVNSSCDMIANESPQGAAIYLLNVKSAMFENHIVTDSLASSGSAMYVVASSVVAKGVTFESTVGLQEYTTNRAIHLDARTTLDAEKCVFDGWLGDIVVYNLNSANGSLVLNSCDFSGSSAILAVVSPNSDAEVRNAVVSSLTLKNAVANTLNDSLTLVDRALDCSDSNACGDGDCVDSVLGVLCECLEGGECLSDGGELSLSLSTPPKQETFSPDAVSYELLVSSAVAGTTSEIWNLVYEGGDLDLDVVPSSGVLPPGGSATVTVTGTSSKQDVGGNLTNTFSLKSGGSARTDSTGGASLEVISTFYLCQAYEYASPQIDDDANGILCVQCATINMDKGVDCDHPGATLASLPIRPGYWRSSAESRVVQQCLHSDACSGSRKIANANDYCADGYSGPYCAVCSDGYGRGVSNSCHRCDNTKAHLLFALGALFCLMVLLLMFLAVVFLIGGLDAINIVRQSVGRTLFVGSKASSTGPSVPRARSLKRSRSLGATVAPVFTFAMAAKHGDGGGGGGGGGGEGTPGRSLVFPTTQSDWTDTEGMITPAFGTGVSAGAGVELSHEAGRFSSAEAGMSAGQQLRLSAASGFGAGRGHANTIMKADTGERGDSIGCGLGVKVKRFWSRLPLDKLKILVVVWQILAVFSSITGVEFPASYSTFLAWISVVNLDIGSIFSASCVLSSMNFYARLLATTLAPLVLAIGLVLTYHTAKRRSGIGSIGVIARRAAWSRHVAAGLLLTFLVFTSASTVAFKTFACDEEVVDGESYLRADYSISCTTSLHMLFKVYAGIMILVYPVGIPVLYALILWKDRELLNPRIHVEPDEADEEATTADAAGGDKILSVTLPTTSKGRTKNVLSYIELEELEKQVKARKANPELVPSMFLWKDFGPDLYYYEVIECGRRILLTGLLIFIAPHTATQAAMACLFAFASLLGFELMRPHMDPADSWLYRLGCVIIFLSNFLALLIKVDAGDYSNRDAFGILLVAVNVLLVVAVIGTSWFAVQQSVDDSREEGNSVRALV